MLSWFVAFSYSRMFLSSQSLQRYYNLSNTQDCIHLYCVFQSLLGRECLPAEGAQNGTDKRRADEYPDVFEGLAAGEDCGTERTGGVDRSAGEVDADKVHQDEAEADGESGEVAGSDFAVSGAEDDQHEKEGCYYFHKDGAPGTASVGYAIGAEASGQVRCADYACYGKEKRACDDTADELSYPVAAGVLPTHTAGEGYAEGNGGIDVATADAADGVCHGYDGKAERYRSADYAGRSVTTEEHRCPASQESENESAQALSKILFHIF